MNDGGARTNCQDVEKWVSCQDKSILARETQMSTVRHDFLQCLFVPMGLAGEDLEVSVKENQKDSFILRTVSTNLRKKTLYI